MARTKVPEKEWKVVLVRSGGVCAFPGCSKPLTESGNSDDSSAFIGEVAHIVADSRQGPRGDSNLSDKERDRDTNLILLCQNCHDKVDKQPRTYSVSVLQRMKAEHEKKVSIALGVPQAPDFQMQGERILSSLLPISHLPRTVFAAPCGYGDRQDGVVKQQLVYPNDPTEIVRFLIREKTLFSFHDLRDPDGPFASIININQVKKFEARKFWSTAEGHRRYSTLLNRSLYKFASTKGISFDPTHFRFYFHVEKPGQERSVEYRPLNRSTESRQVAWEEKRKSTGEGKGFWWHLAVGMRFHRMADDQWCLSLRPERHLTTNGEIPLPPEKIGRKVTRLKANMFNNKYLSEVNFWRDFLSNGSPRFILNFGKQSVAVSTDFIAFDIDWPGIPEDSIEFRNQHYEEDLFSFAAFENVKNSEEEFEWDDEGEFDESDESL